MANQKDMADQETADHKAADDRLGVSHRDTVPTPIETLLDATADHIRPRGTDPVAPSGAGAAVERAGAEHSGGGAPRNEWTVSDDRGPLGTASDGGLPEPPETATASEVPERFSASSDPEAPHDPAFGSADPVTADPATGTTTVGAGEVPRAPSRWPIAAGLVIGAIIGAGSAGLVYSQSGPRQTTAGPDPQVAALSSRVDALEKRPAGSSDKASSESTSAMRTSIGDLQTKVAALEKTAASDKAAPASVDLKPLEDRIGALQSDVAKLKAGGAADKGLDAKIAALEGAVAGMKSATATTQAGVASVEGRQKALSDKVMMPALAVVADSLVQQIDRGDPYAAQVDALAALDADATKIAVLRQNAEKGVPSAKMLAAGFEPLAEPIMASAHKAPPHAGFVDRLKSGMMSIVSVRRADDTSGDDLPSRVARIRADLAHDDVPAALATWDALPPEAKAHGDAWAAKAKTAAEAIAAARGLQHDAIVALSAKRS